MAIPEFGAGTNVLLTRSPLPHLVFDFGGKLKFLISKLKANSKFKI
jgi:hypothetical protein